MERLAERASTPGSGRAYFGHLTMAAVFVLFVAACGGSVTARQASKGAARSTVASTPANTEVSTTSTVPIRFQLPQGDTLTAVAQHFRVSVGSIVAANHLADADLVQAGQWLRIPRAAPLALTVDPSVGFAGQAFRFALRGAIPTETIQFDIVSPTGSNPGETHAVPASGAVAATYQSSAQDRPGIYRVVATGSLGTHVSTYFGVAAPPPGASSNP